LQKAINKAKEQEPEDKKVIAGSIAALVVVILLVAWSFLFLKKMQRNVQTVDLSAGAQDEFNFTSVREAQRAIQESFQYTDKSSALCVNQLSSGSCLPGSKGSTFRRSAAQLISSARPSSDVQRDVR